MDVPELRDRWTLQSCKTERHSRVVGLTYIPEMRDRRIFQLRAWWTFQSCGTDGNSSCRTDGYVRVADSEFTCYDDSDCDDVNGGCSNDDDNDNDNECDVWYDLQSCFLPSEIVLFMLLLNITDRRTNVRINRRTDRLSFRDASTRLKIGFPSGNC